ncbi:MAG: exodeoxyribonuclease VII large subunit [Chitinophagaceae bacterium]|nr:exodeoxyribonuclease VII large subunit [Chitinophagaceae bacterium]
MAEQINDRKVFSLLEVTRSIQKTLMERYTSSFWVKAEMNKLNFYRQSGHAYPELVEKKEGKIIAEIRANLWRDDYRRINLLFQEVLHEPLKDGIKVLMLAKVGYDPVYGLSLTILDIDPSFTLGDLEREKQENLQRLRNEGLFNLNKLLEMPLLPKRIAIISVETSKGYSDFMSVLDNNPWGYRFFHMLFPALLQGDKSAADITRQLNRIRSVSHHFDVVAIIRGGGGDVGLTCYNDYKLASIVCQFPIPVITGIGHSTNETITEMVSHFNAITPTKLAEYLMQLFHNFSVPVQEAEKNIIEKSRQLLANENNRFTAEFRSFKLVTQRALNDNQQQLKQHAVLLRKDSKVVLKEAYQVLKQFRQQLQQHSAQTLRDKQTELHNIAKQVDLMSPASVLQRGYSITRINGKLVKDIKDLKPGDEISTHLYEGNISSVVTSLHKQEPNE